MAPIASPIPTEPTPIVLPDFVPRFVGRLLDLAPIREVRLVLEVHGTAGGGLLAAGIAYRVLFAVAPAILLLVAVLGFIVADEATRAAVVDALGALFPPLADILDSSLEALAQGAVSVSIVSLVILLWGASGLYMAIEEGVGRMIPFGPLRDPTQRTIGGLLAVVVVIGAVIALLVLAAVVDLIGDAIPALEIPQISSLPIGRLITIVGTAGLVALAYRYLPSVRPPWAAAAVPGLLAGASIALLTILYVVIAPQLAGLSFLYGSLATVLVTLAWVGIVAQVLLYGAAWTAVRWSRALARPASEGSGGDATNG